MPVNVLYILDLKGSLKQGLDDIGVGLLKAATQADKFKDIGEKGAAVLGGTFADLSDIVLDMGSEVAEVATSLGGLTGATVGVAGGLAILTGAAVLVTKATKEWLDESVELRKELVQQGVLTKQDAAGLVEYGDASKRLTTQLSLLQVEIANELAPAMEYFLDILTGGVSKVRDFVDLYQEFDGIEAEVRKLGDGWSQLADIIDYNVGVAEDFWAIMKVISTGGGSLVIDKVSAMMGGGGPEELAAAGRATQSDVAYTGSIYGPTPEQLLAIDQARFDAQKKAAAEGRSAGIFEGGGSVAELEASIEFARYWQAEVIPALNQIADDTQIASDDLQASWRDMLASIEATGPSFLETAQGITTGLGTGSVSGFLGATGVAVDPVSALVMELIGLIKDPSALFELFGEVFDTYMNLDDWVSSLVTGLIDNIIANLPEMAAAFTVLGPAVALALVDAAPALFAAVIDALFELPSAFADAIARTIVQAGDAFNPFNDDVNISNPFARGGALATHFGEGSDSFLGFNIGTFASGGMFHSDGLAYVHGGEVLLNRDQQRSVMGGGTTHVTVNMYGVQDMDRFVEDLQNRLGPYGFNLALTPRVS